MKRRKTVNMKLTKIYSVSRAKLLVRFFVAVPITSKTASCKLRVVNTEYLVIATTANLHKG